MNIKVLSDYNKLKNIYNKHYKNEFSFPSFEEFIIKFQVNDEKDNLVVAGGMRMIPEIILITDKDAPVLDRRIALLTALDYMIHNGQQMSLRELHAFIQDPKWSKQLQRIGFVPTKGQALVMGI